MRSEQKNLCQEPYSNCKTGFVREECGFCIPPEKARTDDTSHCEEEILRQMG